MKKHIKSFIKRFVKGETIRRFQAYIKYVKSLTNVYKSDLRIHINRDETRILNIFSQRGKHVFCGYFDIVPNSSSNKELCLLHILDKSAKQGNDTISICVGNIISGEIKKIATSNAWCWQMGSRLRWSNINSDLIYYNDFQKGQYCCCLVDVLSGRLVDVLPFALYDISPTEEYGLSLNFSRLQRLRPGYGYCNEQDFTNNINVPANDGLFYVDLKSKTKKLLVSFSQLAEQIPQASKSENYINHISISPTGKNAMFFYIWKTNSAPGWHATLWGVNVITGEFWCIEKENQVSHYAWKNNDELLITGIDKSLNKGFYRVYNFNTGDFWEYTDVSLKEDGHPRYSRSFNGFYSDTYPDSKEFQKFFKYDEEKKFIELVKLYHDPKLFGEKRCDLHPHYFDDCEYVALDTTFKHNRRSVIVLDCGRENYGC